MATAAQATSRPVELLRELVELESPTDHGPGVRAVAERIAEELPDGAARVRFERDHLVAELDGEGEPLLVLGHTDTVWPLGTLASMPFRVTDDCAYGPGAFDMKAGLVVLAEALRETGPGRRPLRVFLTADEERGSPDHAEARIEIRVAHAADSKHVDEALSALHPAVGGTRLRLEEEHGRPPLERSGGSAALFAKAYQHGRALGLDLRETSSGGGSDGNLVGALGVPVPDGLGAEGGGAHARGEHVRLSSIPQRARLLARLLEDPGL